MAQINTANSAVVTARLLHDPKVFSPNKDNSQGVALSLWYKSGFGKDAPLRNVELKGFIPANEDGSVNTGSVYSFLSKGDLVQIAYEPQVESYTDASGKKVYNNVNKIVRGGITLMDNRSEAGSASKAAPAAQQAEQAQAPETVGAV